MNDLFEFLTSQEIIIVYLIAALACVICIIVYVIEKGNDKARRRHNTKELNKLVDIIKDQYIEEDNTPYYEEPVIMVAEDVKDDTPLSEMINDSGLIVDVNENDPTDYFNTNSDMDFISQEPENNNNQTIDLEQIKIDHYEEEQERSAIISLEELFSKAKEMYISNETTQYADEGNEPISLQDLEKSVDKKAKDIVDSFEMNKVVSEEEVLEEIKKEEVLHMDDFNTISSETVNPVVYKEPTERKFKCSPIISPIFGIKKEPTDNTLALENTANYEKLDEQIRKNNEFVMSLQELQDKLE